LKEFFSGDNNSDPICIKRGEEEGPIWVIGWWCCSAPSVLIMSINLQKMEAFLGLLPKKKREEKPQTGKASCQLVPFIEICETSRKCKEHLEKISRVFGGHLIHITTASSKIGETQVASSRGKWPLAPL
jgi:16S rRNA C1402 (ribose-2'-O) methylase RsmI